MCNEVYIYLKMIFTTFEIRYWFLYLNIRSHKIQAFFCIITYIFHSMIVLLNFDFSAQLYVSCNAFLFTGPCYVNHILYSWFSSREYYTVNYLNRCITRRRSTDNKHLESWSPFVWVNMLRRLAALVVVRSVLLAITDITMCLRTPHRQGQLTSTFLFHIASTFNVAWVTFTVKVVSIITIALISLYTGVHEP